MSDLEAFLCLGGYELGNLSRVTTYGHGLFFDGCDCPALDDTYVSPSEDSAPWYDANHPESAEFFGFLPQSINLSVAASRAVTDVVGTGSVVGPEKLPGRVVEVTGWLTATTQAAMYWGKNWLREAARGAMCKGNCAGDVLDLLAYCRDDCPDGDCSGDFRFLVGTALVSGPNYTELQADACSRVVEAQFQFTSTMPWLYHPAVTQVDAETVTAGDSSCTLVTTETWMDGEALVIDLQAGEAAAAGPLTLTITFSLDGNCPETRVPASVTYLIPSLGRSAGLTIDGTRRQVIFHNPTAKRDEPGFSLIDFDGPFCWPIIGPCSEVCVCLSNGGASDVQWKVRRYQREL